MARILGLEIRFAAPKLAITGTRFAAFTDDTIAAAKKVPAKSASIQQVQDSNAKYVQRTQTLPVAQYPTNQNSELPLRGRAVASEPLSDWYLNLPQKIPPKQIESILRQALAGNIWQQTQLARLMADTWPMFAKCCFELRAAIASAKYTVHPYTKPGQKPTASAKAKADLVQEALEAFDPDRFADEDGLNGMIFDLTDAIINGVSLTEMIWNDDETLVRASAWVHPRNLAFTPDGRIGVASAAESGNMSFSNQVRQKLMDNPEKFLVAKFKSKSGSFLGAGWMRKLADYWVWVMYGREFALNFAQKYGNPFLSFAYESGTTTDQQVDEFGKIAQRASNQNWAVYPSNGKIEVTNAQSMGGDNASIALMRVADEQCQQLMLGQTLTSAAPKNGGSRAQGDVHENVRAERIEEHCKWIAQILTEQFAESILKINYGPSYDVRNRERPTIAPDLTRPMTASEQADYFQKASTTKIPRISSEFYQRGGCQQPEAGDVVCDANGIYIFEEPLTATEKGEKDFDTTLEQQKSTHAEFGDPEGPQPAKKVKAALANASQEDLLELENLVSAAERAPHLNGEAVLVQKKLKELMEKKRP